MQALAGTQAGGVVRADLLDHRLQALAGLLPARGR
jgi:hypothetical protein